MQDSAEALRRWFAMFCLSVATGMLIWGRTLLQSYLTEWRFAVYWILCALFASTAVTLSLIDIALIRRALRQKQRQLVRKAFAKLRRPTYPERLSKD